MIQQWLAIVRNNMRIDENSFVKNSIKKCFIYFIDSSKASLNVSLSLWIFYNRIPANLQL